MGKDQKRQYRNTEAEFMIGLLASLTKSEVRSFETYGHDFTKTLGDLFPSFEVEAERNSTKFSFRIRPDPIHGSSESVEIGMRHAVAFGFASVEHPSYNMVHILIDKEKADNVLEILGCRVELYSSFAQQFKSKYPHRIN